MRDYSFVQETAEPGWLRIHSVMSAALRRRLASDPTAFLRAHTDWHTYWQSRSERDTDDLAALAWYHDYTRDPLRALAAWKAKAKQVRSARDMMTHLELLDWWAPIEIESRGPRTYEESRALSPLGIELLGATLGNRTANLRRAIACFEAALRVYTEADFPATWAMTQNNLGNAYLSLPTGDRCDSHLRAIACYEVALRVYTEANYPTEWAASQDNLGTAYANLPEGNRGTNLRLRHHLLQGGVAGPQQGQVPG